MLEKHLADKYNLDQDMVYATLEFWSDLSGLIEVKIYGSSPYVGEVFKIDTPNYPRIGRATTFDEAFDTALNDALEYDYNGGN